MGLALALNCELLHARVHRTAAPLTPLPLARCIALPKHPAAAATAAAHYAQIGFASHTLQTGLNHKLILLYAI